MRRARRLFAVLEPAWRSIVEVPAHSVKKSMRWMKKSDAAINKSTPVARKLIKEIHSFSEADDASSTRIHSCSKEIESQ